MRTLHARLMLVLALTLVPAGAALLSLTVRSARAYYQEVTQRQNADVAANLVSQHDLMIGHDVDRQKLSEVARNLAMTNPGVEVYVLDPAGRVLAGSIPAAERRRSSVAVEPLRSFVRGDRHFPLLGTDPRLGDRTVFSAAPLAGGGGYLYVVLTDELRAGIMREVQGSTALRVALYGSGAVLVLVLIGGALAFFLLTRRLRRLQRAMTAFRNAGAGAGAVPLTPVAHPHDEIDALRNDFVALTERIGEQVDALRRADRVRRELVTNVSHDLRTPLAALRGSLETLVLKGDGLDEAERSTFLSTAQSQSERLGRLIDQLFELSLLDDDASPLRAEDFPLAELVSDAVQKERPRAEAAGVRLTFETPSVQPVVRGNLGLIERTLLNLVDNALRHTPDGGEVRVSLWTEPDGRVAVEVRDTGEGIAPEHQPRIFERFYRVGDGTSRAGDGAGLGLAIAARVVELHGGSLSVVSRLGEGSRFRFDLPPAPRRDRSVNDRDGGANPGS
ncbi:MAG: ATP-binding protein [Deinococcales bacterium]